MRRIPLGFSTASSAKDTKRVDGAAFRSAFSAAPEFSTTVTGKRVFVAQRAKACA